MSAVSMKQKRFYVTIYHEVLRCLGIFLLFCIKRRILWKFMKKYILLFRKRMMSAFLLKFKADCLEKM